MLTRYKAITESNALPVTERYMDAALEEIRAFHDSRHGGFFMGLGFWFSSPHDAAVPLARIVMNQRNALGGINIGNTRYIPLNQKQTSTQIACYNALSLQSVNLDTATETTTVKVHQWKKVDIHRELTPVVFEKLSDNLIDIPGYIKWLEGTRAGFGYGLTPYKSPVSFRSDTTPQTFSALRVIADLYVLGSSDYDKDNILTGLKALQDSDGGFSRISGHPSETTDEGFIAIHALHMLENKLKKYWAISIT